MFHYTLIFTYLLTLHRNLLLVSLYSYNYISFNRIKGYRKGKSVSLYSYNYISFNMIYLLYTSYLIVNVLFLFYFSKNYLSTLYLSFVSAYSYSYISFATPHNVSKLLDTFTALGTC